MCAPSGNSEFCFPSSLNVSLDFVSGEIKLVSKEVSRAEPEYMNIHPPPPISVLATDLEALDAFQQQ